MTDVWRAVWSRDGEVLCSLEILPQDKALDALSGEQDDEDDGPIPVDYLVRVETLRSTARELRKRIGDLTCERDEARARLDASRKMLEDRDDDIRKVEIRVEGLRTTLSATIDDLRDAEGRLARVEHARDLWETLGPTSEVSNEIDAALDGWVRKTEAS